MYTNIRTTGRQRQYRYVPNVTGTRGREGAELGEGFIGEAGLHQDVRNEHRCLPFQKTAFYKSKEA